MAPLTHVAPQHGSPCSAGSLIFDSPADEREFGRFPSMIPETQGIGKLASTEPKLQKFTPPKNDMSESALAEGFSWQPKRPVRPGQFSERPNQKTSATPLKLPGGVFEGTPAGPKADLKTSPKLPSKRDSHNSGPRPLELPELVFEKIPERLTITQKEYTGSSPSHKGPLSSLKIIGNGETPKRSRDAVTGSPLSGIQASSTSAQGLGVDLGDPTQIKRTSAPFHDLPPVLSPRGSGDHGMGSMNGITASPPEDTTNSTLSKLGERTDLPQQKVHRRSNGLPSHIRPLSQNRGQHCPSSVCGDLEGPTHQTPRQSHRSRMEAFHPTAWEVNGQRGTSRISTQRSQSRTSNISRKRAAVRKSIHSEDAVNKKALMEKVAQNWNKCMQLVESEKQEALYEIQHLQDNIARKSKDLKDAQGMLSRREAQIEEVKRRYKKVEEQQSMVAEQNKQFSSEVESLRRELLESKEKAAQMGEKYKTYKDKINDAITEQQDLYKRTRAYYQHMLEELEQEKLKQDAKAIEIDEALKVSRQKRKQMKETFEVLQTRIQEQSAEKTQEILKLKAQIQCQEKDLLRERDILDNLRVQMEQTQTGTYQLVQGLDTKVTSLTELCEDGNHQSKRSHDLASHLSEKVDFLADSVQSAFQNMLTPVDVTSILSGFEDRITARIASEFAGIHSRQDKFEHTVFAVGGGLEKELSDIKSAMSAYWCWQQTTKENHDHAIDAATEKLEQVHADLVQTRELCQDKQGCLATCVAELAALKEDRRSLEALLTQQFKDRDGSLLERERQLQDFFEGFAENVRQIQENFTSNSRLAEVALQAAIGQFRELLDTALSKDREWSAQKLGQTQRAISSPLGRIKSTETAIAGGPEQHAADINQLKRELQKEKTSVLRLTEEVQKSKQMAADFRSLQDRWMRDIQQIDSLRAKLSAAHHRIPRVEGIAAKLENIGRLNGLIRSTASYLSTERRWVQDELASRSEDKHGLIGEEELSHRLQHSQIKDTDETDFTPQSQSTARGMPEVSAVPDGCAVPASAIDSLEFSPRKVTVLNPAMDFKSPSPPPSIEQEQMRRREGKKPRSILRFVTDFDQQDDTPTAEALRLPLNHSQYNRPVMATPNSTSSGGSNTKVVEQIRSSFVSTSHSEPLWAFPTVAEFEQSGQLRTQGPQAGDKRKSPFAVDSIHNIAKRFKSGPQATSPGDLRASVKSADIPARPAGMPSHRPVRRTYSRKVDE